MSMFFSCRQYKSSWSTTVTHWFGKAHWTGFLLKGHWILENLEENVFWVRVLLESSSNLVSTWLGLARLVLSFIKMIPSSSFVYLTLGLDNGHAHLTRPLDTWHSALTAALTRLLGTWDSAPRLDTWHSALATALTCPLETSTWHLTLGPDNGLDTSTWHLTPTAHLSSSTFVLVDHASASIS